MHFIFVVVEALVPLAIILPMAHTILYKASSCMSGLLQPYSCQRSACRCGTELTCADLWLVEHLQRTVNGRQYSTRCQSIYGQCTTAVRCNWFVIHYAFQIGMAKEEANSSGNVHVSLTALKGSQAANVNYNHADNMNLE